jgi:acyl carrier protein
MRSEQVDTSADAIAAWCQQYVAELLEIPVDVVDRDTDFDRLGIDSALAVSLLIEVEEHYDVDLAPETLFENTTLNAIAAYLHSQIKESAA